MLTRRQLLAGAGALLLAPRLALGARGDPPKVELATMSLDDSPWGKVLSVWARAVEKAVDDQVEIAVTHDGGEYAVDEWQVVQRLLKERFDGASLSSPGLGGLVSTAQALHLPGLFPDWAAVAEGLEAARGSLEGSLGQLGYTCLGWGNMGVRYLFTQSSAVRTPADLAGLTPWAPSGDAVLGALLERTGLVDLPVTPEAQVLRRLRQQRINAVIATPLAVEQRGWADHLDRVFALPMGHVIGATVVRTEALDALPDHVRAALMDSGPVASMALDERMEDLDAAALTRLSGRLERADPTEADRDAWAELFAGARQDLLDRGTLDPAVLALLEA